MAGDNTDRLRLVEVAETPCLAVVDQRPWAETVGLRAGDTLLGVRTNTVAATGLLRDLLSARVVPDIQAPRNLSLWVAPFTNAGIQDLHCLYTSHVRTMRTRSARRVPASLWHEFDMHDLAVAGQRLFDVAVLIEDGRAHVLPAWVRGAVVDDQRRWERGGPQLLERRWVHRAEGSRSRAGRPGLALGPRGPGR
jgi:hypothetical protein